MVGSGPRRDSDRIGQNADRTPLQRAGLGGDGWQPGAQRWRAGEAFSAQPRGRRSLVGVAGQGAVRTIREGDIHPPDRYLRRTSPYRQTLRRAARGRSGARELFRHLSVLRPEVGAPARGHPRMDGMLWRDVKNSKKPLAHASGSELHVEAKGPTAPRP